MKKSLLILMAILPLSACVTREKVEADIFLNDKIPESLCPVDSNLWHYGIARVVLCKNKPESEFCQNGEESFEQFIPYCDPVIEQYLSMHREDAVKWLDKLTTPKPRK